LKRGNWQELESRRRAGTAIFSRIPTEQKGLKMKKSASAKAGIRPDRVPTLVPEEGVKLTTARRRDSARLLQEYVAGDGEVHAITFTYFNPTAREVLVGSSFNNWKPTATPMTKQRGGQWSTEVLLPPGHYEYRLVVDGQWQDDPMASRFVTNPFGGLNCVIEVKAIAPARRGARP
jgi:hypothetical protein